MKIEKDKLAHILCGLGLGAFLGWFIPNLIIVIMIITLGAILWELLWNYYKGKPIDYYDILAGISGGIIGALIIRL